MSALSIQVPFPVFQGRDGQPLENGYVWIGEANLNPQTNPVTVYFDAALTIPAAQPLRTINGYVSRAGTPAQIYVDGVNFSILVQDSKGSMVYNFPEGTGISPDACGVIYNPPFTGAVPTPVCVKLAETVSVQDFGATSGADTAAINAAIAYAVNNSAVVNFDFNATIRIPTDAPNLQAAIDAINASPNVTITLNIEAGHALTSGFRVTNRDCSFMQITSNDATVTVSPFMTLVSNTDLSSDVPRSSMIGFLGVRSKMPTWNILVDISAVNCVTAFELDYASDGVVLPGKGVINAQRGGLGATNCRVTTNSRLQAAQSIWSGAENGNVAVTQNSFANFQNADLSNSQGVQACLDVSRGSVVHALQANCSNSERGVYSRRSFVSCQQVNVSNCGRGIWASAGSHVAAPDAVFDGCTTDVACESGSIVGLNRAQKSGADLNPADSVVQVATSGTAAPRAFNIAGGYGMIAYSNNLPGNAEYLTAGSTASMTAASLQNIEALTYATAVSFTGKRFIYGGTIYGADVGVKITIDGVVVLNDGARAIGKDGGGDDMAVVNIPPCKCENSILIEAFNRSSSTRNIGWRIYHSEAL
jgi:hypothetical protein